MDAKASLTSFRDRLLLRLGGQELLAKMGWLTCGQVVRAVVVFTVAVWIARYLGPQDYGVYTYGVALVGLFLPFASMGTDRIFLRELGVREAKVEVLIGSTLLLRLISGTVIVFLPIICVILLRPSDSELFWFVAIYALIILLNGRDIFSLWFQATSSTKYIAVADVLSVLIYGIAVWLLISWGASVAELAVPIILQILTAAAILGLAYQRLGRSLTALRASIGTMTSLLRDGFPLLLSAVAIVIYMRVDQIMIGQMRDDAEVGYYGAAVRLAEIWYFIPVAVNNILLPRLAEAAKLGDSSLLLRMRRLYNSMSLLGYAVAIPTTFLADPIITLIFGDKYEPAAPMLAVLTWAGLFVALGVTRTSYMTVKHMLAFLPVMVFVGLFVNVALNLVLIPLYGGIGAAIATVISYWVSTHAMSFVVRPLIANGQIMTRALLTPRI